MVTAAMVGIDAEIVQPSIVSTTTTRDPVSPARLREGQAQFVREVRARIAPGARYCSFLEFTTGKAETSGGIRRPHQHALWKGLDPEQGPEVNAIAVKVWKRIAGAWRHEVEELRTPGGCVKYVAEHHRKESQAPPLSWGPTRRVRPSRGYWEMPAAELRSSAETRLRDNRIAHRLTQMLEEQNVPAEAFDEVWEGFRARAMATAPEVVRVKERFGRTIVVL